MEIGQEKTSEPPELRQDTADHQLLSAASPQPASSQLLLGQPLLSLTYLPALEEAKLVELRQEEPRQQLADARRKAEEETKLVEIMLATPPQLLPYSTPKKVSYEIGSPKLSSPGLRQATADHQALRAISTQQFADARRKAEEESKLEETRLMETKLATPLQLLPNVTPMKVGDKVGCKVGTSVTKPWPDHLPPKRPPRYLGTSEKTKLEKTKLEKIKLEKVKLEVTKLEKNKLVTPPHLLPKLPPSPSCQRGRVPRVAVDLPSPPPPPFLHPPLPPLSCQKGRAPRVAVDLPSPPPPIPTLTVLSKGTSAPSSSGHPLPCLPCSRPSWRGALATVLRCQGAELAWRVVGGQAKAWAPRCRSRG